MTLVLTILGLTLTAILNAILAFVFDGTEYTYYGISFILVWIFLYNTCLSNAFDKFTFNFWQILFFISMMMVI